MSEPAPGEVEHPARGEHVDALGVDVAGGDVLHDGGRAPALGVDEEVRAGLRLGALTEDDLLADDDGIHRALFKLEAALPDEYRPDIQSARERILFDTSAWRQQSTTTAYLERIRTAVMEQQQLEILYPSGGAGGSTRPQWRRVEPYGLVYKGLLYRHIRTGIWYLVAFSLACQAFRTFRISAIEDLRVCDEKISIHPNFDLSSYWQEARRQLEEQTRRFALLLRVAPSTRPRLLNDYLLQREESDGSLVVRVWTESLEEAIAYVLSLGSKAVVLGPPEVREGVAQAAREIADRYQQEEKRPPHPFQGSREADV